MALRCHHVSRRYTVVRACCRRVAGFAMQTRNQNTAGRFYNMLEVSNDR